MEKRLLTSATREKSLAEASRSTGLSVFCYDRITPEHSIRIISIPLRVSNTFDTDSKSKPASIHSSYPSNPKLFKSYLWFLVVIPAEGLFWSILWSRYCFIPTPISTFDRCLHWSHCDGAPWLFLAQRNPQCLQDLHTLSLQQEDTLEQLLECILPIFSCSFCCRFKGAAPCSLMHAVLAADNQHTRA